MTEKELIHYGILGMKWGKRKNKTSTRLENIKKNKKTYADETLYKKEIKDEKSRINISNLSSKSNHRLKLEDRYKKQGLNADEAAVAADQRIKVEKTLAVVGGLALTAAAVYATKKTKDYFSDTVLKKNEVLQNISTDKNKGVKDAFYTSFNKKDNVKYEGLYGNQLLTVNALEGKNVDVYKTNIKVAENIKVASRNNVKKQMQQLMDTDTEYKENVKNFGKSIKQLKDTGQLDKMPNQKQADLYRKTANNLSKGKIGTKEADMLNLFLVDHSKQGNSNSKKLYDALKNKGYGAVQDINDKKYSGYNSKNPLIVFDENKVNVLKRTLVDEKKIKTSAGKTQVELVTKSAIKELSKITGLVAAPIVAVKTMAKINSPSVNAKIVSKYRKKHPNTQKTANEILNDANKLK